MAIAKKLSVEIDQQIQSIEWQHIKPHAEREAVIRVSPELSLVEVGVCVVADTVDQVQKWLDEGKIAKITPEEIQLWDQTPDKIFDFIILQPFVLIQQPGH